MAASQRPVEFVVMDLDGLILDTETLCMQVASDVLAKRGAALTAAATRAALGKRPLEAWQGVAAALGLPGAESAGAELLAESEPLLSARWGEARPMPGALRLLRHLAALRVPVAVATSTPRASFEKKLAGKPELRSLLTRCGGAVACGDEVAKGKPAPDVFELAVAKLLLWQQASGGVAAGTGETACPAAPASAAEPLLPAAREALRAGRVAVFEDAPSGVEGALAAGARVVVVPSLREPSAYPSAPAAAAENGESNSNNNNNTRTSGCLAADVPSLLAFDPRCLGLAPFDDLVPSARPQSCGGGRGAVPLDPPLRIRGAVVRGFGRGSRELGIPTANVDPDALVTEMAEAVTGIYVGWACVGDPASPRLAVSGGGVGEEAAAAAAAGGGAAAAAANGSATNAVVAAAIPRGVYPTALSCGYNPQFDGTRRTCEPWILADFGEGAEFYGEEIRLVITGYLRPEAKFVSVAALVEQIHGDARDARRALADPRFLRYARDAFLTSA